MGLSAKEQCFKDAYSAYTDAFPDKDPKIELWKDWYRDAADGKWHKADFFRRFEHWIGSIFKTRRIMNGEDDPRPEGEPNPEQWRQPDITGPDNKVYDLKFTDANGKTDPWGSKPGMGGKNQQEDQRDINKQVDPNSNEMSLDKDSCKCEERGEPEPVAKYEMSPFIVPGVNLAPRAVPEGVPGAAPPVVEPAPVFEPIPVL